MLPAAFINPGDVTLMTVPGYPVAGTHTRITAARCTGCRCWRRTISFPIWNRFRADVLRRAKLLVLSYPNSPTGRVATREFYQRVIEFARSIRSSSCRTRPTSC